MFVKEDLDKYRAFKKVVLKSKVEIFGEAAVGVASLYQWFYALEKKILDSAIPKKAAEKCKEIKNVSNK
jgi:hypothetical protein